MQQLSSTRRTDNWTPLPTARLQDIVEPERIVYTANIGPATIRVTIEFFDEGNGTRVVVTQEGFPDPQLGAIVSEGMNESFEKLDQLFAARSASTK